MGVLRQPSSVSVMAHCTGRGEEILVGNMAHITLWEQGGVAQVIIIVLFKYSLIAIFWLAVNIKFSHKYTLLYRHR